MADLLSRMPVKTPAETEVKTLTADDLKDASQAANTVVTAPATKVETKVENKVEAKAPIKTSTKASPIIQSAEISDEDLFDMDETMAAKLDSIESIPLGAGSELDVKAKRKEYKYYWGNRVAKEGGRYNQLLSLGFVNATPDDVEASPSQVKDGCIIQGDLILMKMPIRKYLAAIKANMNRAQALGSKVGMDAQGKSEGARAIAEVKAPGAYDIRGKVSTYIPPIGEISGKL